MLDNDLATAGNDAIQNVGIFVSGLSFGCTISGNIIGNFPITTTQINKGIWISTACSTLVVKNNTISGISYNGFLFNGSNAPIGIDISSNGGFDIIIDGNLVSGISAATGGVSATGISLAGSSSTVTIKNNQVSSITNSSFLGKVIGISHNPTSAGGINALFNNFIYDVHADGANGASYGIYMGPTEGFRQINHNNVLLTDPEGVSYAFYIDAPSNNRGSCRNNNFINRSASSFDSYAIFQANSNSAFLMDGINYNNVEGTPLAAYNNEVLTTLAAVHTRFGANTVNIPTVFVSNTDLHIVTFGNAGLDNKGTPIATIFTDIDGDARSSVSPDIGADEFGNITGAALIISCTSPATVFCPGAAFNLSYVVQGTPNPGNIYTAELSNAIGSFNFPVSIGTLTSTANSGVISVSIPATASGSFYRIRVKSSAPAYTGTDNGTDLIIKKPFTGIITGGATTIIGTLTPYSVVQRVGSSYVWSFSNGVQNTGGVTNTVTGTFNTLGIQNVNVIETDQNGCQGTSFPKMVTVTTASNNVVLSGSLTGSFLTLKEAFDAVNASNGSGNVIITIIGNTVETAQAILNQTFYSVLVVPQGNRIVEGNLAIPVILLLGADNVTFNGQSLTGANTLTLRNTNIGTSATVIRLQNAASGNAIRKCILEGSANGTVVSSSALHLSNGTAGDNLNNIIDSNLIRPSTVNGLTYGITVGSGNNTTNNTFTNTQITNNYIENVFSRVTSIPNVQSTGILIRNNTINTLIKGNSIYNNLAYNNTVTGASYWGIRINAINTTLGTGTTIDSNYIGGAAPVGGGGKMLISSPNNSLTFAGIYLNENSSAAAAVTRNVIKNISIEVANPDALALNPFLGIWAVKANLQAFNNNNIGDVTNNSISLLMKLGSAFGVDGYGFIIQPACATPIANNYIGGINITASAEAGITGVPSFTLFNTTGISVANIKNNTIGAAIANSISVTNTAQSLFILNGILNDAPANSASFNIDSNVVRNITAANTYLTAIKHNNSTTSATTATVTMNGNAVTDILLSGTSGNATGLLYLTASDVTNLVHTLTANGNLINNISATNGTGNLLDGLRVINNNTTVVNRIKGSISNNTVTNIINNSTGTGGATSAISYANDIIIGDSMVMASNSISGVTDAGTTLSTNRLANCNGITVNMTNSGINGTAIIRDNIVSGVTASATASIATSVNGISVFGNATVIERNKIYNLQSAATSFTARLEAITLTSRSDDANTALVSNNMVALNTTTMAQIAAIHLQDAAVKANIYHNSIVTEGSSVNNSYALLKDAVAIADVKNNIFYNAVTGAGTAFSIGLQNSATGYTGNNNYFVSPAIATLTQVGAASHTLASWQIATTQDAAAQQGQSGVTTNASNLFINKALVNLLINISNTTEPIKLSDKGISLSGIVSYDFLNTLRSISTPDIGAHEFVFASTKNWTGNVSTAWENAGNWEDNLVPTATSNVVIPAARPRYPIISISTTIKSISAAQGTSVNVADGVNVIINDK